MLEYIYDISSDTWMIVGFIVMIAIIYYFIQEQKKAHNREKKERELFLSRLQENKNDDMFISYDELFHYYNEKLNVTGTYIIWNKTQDIFYIGQSKNIIKRVYNHFNGRGNEAVHYDILKGDQFVIRLIALNSSDFLNIDDQESYYIELYEGFTKGYNKNRGNNLDHKLYPDSIINDIN